MPQMKIDDDEDDDLRNEIDVARAVTDASVYALFRMYYLESS